jgi:hypothetical protein
VVALLRVVALVLGLQLSGAAPLLGELVCVIAEASEHEGTEQDEECPEGRPCHDCPPGCPACRCASNLRSLAADAHLNALPARPLASLIAMNDGLMKPSGAELTPPFKPPRSSSGA